MMSPNTTLQFSKMHGLGNDFMVIEVKVLDQLPILQHASIWRAWADRHTGIGFDQALLILPATEPSACARYQIFNADGSEVEQCGNGARCVAEWLRLNGRCELDAVIRLQSRGGEVIARFTSPGCVAVNMGEPKFPAHPRQSINTDLTRVEFIQVSMGNPHIVIDVPNIDTANVKELGPLLESHPHFPQRTNVGFSQRLDRQRLRLRVYERGAGETQACGTGACAAMAAGHLAGQLDDQVQVQLPGGNLQIEWQGLGSPLWMTGEAIRVFIGEIEIPCA
ncbi:MAG: diaminopimelate epimerase [Steroidobacteraceae bacterium]|jgi:diaminopimelate epimerase